MIIDPNKTRPARYPGVYITNNNFRYILDKEGQLYSSDRNEIVKPEIVGFFQTPIQNALERNTARTIIDQVIFALNRKDSSELYELIMKYGTNPRIGTRLVVEFPKESNQKGIISPPITQILGI